MLFQDMPSCEPLDDALDAAPDGVLFERRKGPRRRLQQPTDVRLRGVGDEMQWGCAGPVLNLGIDGLACRLATADAMRLLVDQHVDAAFRIESVAADFDLRARVTNITPAGSAAHRVIGLEFVDGIRLRDAGPALREAIRQAVESKG